jgi:hypothetical protein
MGARSQDKQTGLQLPNEYIFCKKYGSPGVTVEGPKKQKVSTRAIECIINKSINPVEVSSKEPIE